MLLKFFTILLYDIIYIELNLQPQRSVGRDDGERGLQKYRKEELIGSGGFGQVFAGYKKRDNQPVAIKVVKKKKVRIIFPEIYLTKFQEPQENPKKSQKIVRKYQKPQKIFETHRKP